MDSTQRHLQQDDGQAQEPSPFRKYGWVLAAMALMLALLCSGIGLLEASSGGSIMARLRGGSVGPAPTFIPARSEQLVSTVTPTADLSPTPTETLPPSETPTPTATATRRPSTGITCRCQGATYACSDGSATYNSTRCAPKSTPVCGCQGHDWVCDDGSRTANDLRCGTVCECKGNDLYCNDGTVGIFNPQCACHCDGTTMVCNDGGSEPNAAFCKGKKK